MAEEIQLAKQNASRIEEEAAMNTRNEQRALVALGHKVNLGWGRKLHGIYLVVLKIKYPCVCVYIYIYIYIYIHIRIHRHACIHIMY